MLLYIGFAAGVLTVLSFVPQVVRTWRTRKARDLSLGMIVLLVAAGALWIAYGIVSRDLPVIATNVGTVSLNLALIVAKARFR